MFIYLFTLLLIQVPNRKCYHHQGKRLHLTTFQTNNSSINRTINFSIPSSSKSIPNWDWHFTLCEVNKFSITETIFFECPSSSSTLVGIATPYHWVSYGPSSPPFIQSAHPSTENPFCPTFLYEIARNWSSFCVNMETNSIPCARSFHFHCLRSSQALRASSILAYQDTSGWWKTPKTYDLEEYGNLMRCKSLLTVCANSNKLLSNWQCGFSVQRLFASFIFLKYRRGILIRQFRVEQISLFILRNVNNSKSHEKLFAVTAPGEMVIPLRVRRKLKKK